MNQEPLNSRSTTKSELARLLGVSLRTLQRRLIQNNIQVPRGLISHNTKKEILIRLGYDLDSSLDKN